jgi:hypothetical protein
MTEYYGDLAKKKQRAVIDFGKFIDTKNYFNEYLPSKTIDFNENDFTIKDYLNDLSEFNADFQYTLFKSHCGFLQYFAHKWDRVSMANSVEIRSPFLDKNVFLFMLSLPLEMKIKNGKLKSILNDSFSDILPDYIKLQKFKQGLPVSKKNINDPIIKNICIEIINQNEFKNNCWDSKKIKIDFDNSKNMDLIWHIVKYYLLKDGFNKRLDDAKNNQIDFTEVPLLQ